jgi:hypothetical protein
LAEGEGVMPVFTVRRRVDAYVDYTAEVEADSAEAAAERAKDEEDNFAWKCEGECEFDDRLFITLDAEGAEIDGSQVGDI